MQENEFLNADNFSRKWYEDVGDATSSILGGLVGGIVNPLKDKTVTQTTTGGIQNQNVNKEKDDDKNSTNLFLFAGGALVLILIGFIIFSKKK